MEPLDNAAPDTTASPPPAETPAASPDLQQAADALAGQLGRQGGDAPAQTGTEPAAAPPQSALEGQPGAKPAPSRTDHLRTYQTGYQRRIQQERQRLKALEAERTGYDERLRKQNEILQQTLEILRKKGGPEAQEEAPPDPALDPAGFARWLKTSNETAIAGALKPLQEDLEWRKGELQRMQEERAAEAQQREEAARITSQYQSYEAEYAEQAPEVAHGFHERFETSRSLFAGAFEDTGRPKAEAQQLADMFFLAIGRQAEAMGENPVAAIDGFVCALAARFGLEPVGPGDELGGNGNGATPPRQAARQPSETERLAAVQQRSIAAGNAAPRVANRRTTPTSELQELARAGVTNHKELWAAALRDSKGDMKAASLALNNLAGQLAAVR